MKTTPTPWNVSSVDETLIFGPDRQLVATTLQGEEDYETNHDTRAGDAELIVMAVNAYAGTKAREATPMAVAVELIARLMHWGRGAALTQIHSMERDLVEAAALLASQEAEIEAMAARLRETEITLMAVRVVRDDAQARALAAEARVAEEREACAAICQGWLDNFGSNAIDVVTAQEYAVGAVRDVMDFIRARTQKDNPHAK